MTEGANRKEEAHVNKVRLLKVVNAVLAIVFITQAVTGLVMFFDINIVNLRYVFSTHKYSGLALIVLLMIHLSLNWSWVRSTYFSKRRQA
ncbi:MAG: DUF4405 domain-containing protein [Candidatus Omnitrophica bacterium]|nr:DUF4405 domain-containing protein [Candidatus Omnitrophota bacterium]